MDEASDKMAAAAVTVNSVTDLSELFRTHHDLVFRTAWRVAGNAGDAEDVLQTVFLRILRQGWSAENVDNVESYLRRAAVNAALDVVRTRHDARKVPLELVEPVLAEDARLRPDRRQSAGEIRSLLRQAVARLSPKAAEMFVLRYFEGFDNPEIAKMLGTTVTNVAVTLHRTRGQVQADMRSYLETGYEH